MRGVSLLAGSDSVAHNAEVPEVMRLAVNLDKRAPALVALVPVYAGNPAAVGTVTTHIALVFAVRNVAQILNSVVGFQTVDMVNVTSRPRAVDHRPNDAVCELPVSVYLTVAISSRAHPTKRLFASVSRVPLWREVRRIFPEQAEIDAIQKQTFVESLGGRALCFHGGQTQ